MVSAVEPVSPVSYLRPEVIRQIDRLDLKARFIIEGFLTGLHGSPFHGFSTEFAEHRKYEPGDEIATIDWAVYARTDRYYVKKYRAETNVQVFLAVDASPSMAYAGAGGMTKLDYSVALAAALGHLLIRQGDPVGLVTFAEGIARYLPPRARRSQLVAMLRILAGTAPRGRSGIAQALGEIAGLVRRRSMVVVLSDFLQDLDVLLPAIHRLAFRGHEVILFQILDHAELTLPFDDFSEFRDLETRERLATDPAAVRAGYLKELHAFLDRMKRSCGEARVEHVVLDTATPFDRALLAYLLARQGKA